MLLKSPRVLLATAAAALLVVPLYGAVVSRDLDKQLDLIAANAGGLVVYGEITSSKEGFVPSASELKWTVLTVKVESSLLPNLNAPETVTVYFPGYGETRLSISPPEAETRVGEKVLLFLRKDAAVSEADASAYQLDSFAESFRTQTNRRGQVIVLGEGNGSAVPANARLDSLKTDVATAFEAMKSKK